MMRKGWGISPVAILLAGGVSGCEQQEAAPEDVVFAPVYRGVDTQLLDDELVQVIGGPSTPAVGFSLGLFPLLAVAGVFRLRKLGLLPYRMPGFPIAPLLYLVSGSTILVLAYLERPMESSIALLTVAAGIPFYVVFARRKRRS